MNLKNILFSFLFLVIFHPAKAQLGDDFSDGNFSMNPTWLGDDSLFFINSNFQLQSKGSAGSSKDICLTSSSTKKSGEWSCLVRFALSPSTQNFCRFYICSDQPNLKGPLNGYYVQLGGSTGNTDSICLYKQSGLNRTRLIAGRAATVAKSNNQVQVKVNCDTSGNWQLFSDTSAQGNYVLEGTAFDYPQQATLYTGFWVRFTSGNISNYYFDDVNAGEILYDTIPPELSGFKIMGSSKLALTFSEKTEDLSTQNSSNYLLDNHLNPSQIFSTPNSKEIEIQFADSFISGSTHILKINKVQDLSGNTIRDTLIHFTYYLPVKGDLLITEIMPDPEPSQGLPNAEFIELYNACSFPVFLNGFKISDPGSSITLPNYMLEPNHYLILCEKTNEPLFKPFGETLGLPSLPSLNNSGDYLKITNSQNEIWQEINYDLSWYQNASKQNGGWTLEMTNPRRLCTGKANWQASANSLGGTPGATNSHWQTSIDTLAPVLLSVLPKSATEINLTFDEIIDSSLSSNTFQFELSPKIETKNIFIQTNTDKEIQVLLNESLQHKTTYEINITKASDCFHNTKNQNASFTFYDAMPPKQNQVLIDEILFSPSQATQMPDAEFIELINTSNYSVNLKNYSLSDGSNTAFFPELILYPDSFLIVTTIANSSLFVPFGKAIGLSNFPSLNTTDQLTIRNENGFIIHQIKYQENWISNALKKQTGGWTLEMKDTKNPCGTSSNWDVCINLSGGTPGKKNSLNQLNRDNTPPKLLHVYPSDNRFLQCFFSEAIDSLSLSNSNKSHLYPGTPIKSYHYYQGQLNQIAFEFETPFDSSTRYQFTIDSIQDCAGSGMDESMNADFGILHQPDSNNIIINEILFNPNLNGFDFIELYNRSEKYLDLNSLLCGRFNAQNQIEEGIHFGASRMIAPKDFIVITQDANSLMSFYSVPFPEKIIESPLPAMNDDKGSILLCDSAGNIMDQLTYSEKMHFPLLNNTEGVSLERIDPFQPAANTNNWTSASTNCGYASPTYRNSQFTSGGSAGVFSIDPEVFSPDGDGYKDLITFGYDLGENSHVGKIEIYNSSGNLEKQVCRNYSLGSSGKINWNGINDEGKKAAVGIYIVNFEYFNLEGKVNQVQKTFVLGSK